MLNETWSINPQTRLRAERRDMAQSPGLSVEELHCPALPQNIPIRDRAWSKVSVQMLLFGLVTVPYMCHFGTSHLCFFKVPQKGVNPYIEPVPVQCGSASLSSV